MHGEGSTTTRFSIASIGSEGGSQSRGTRARGAHAPTFRTGLWGAQAAARIAADRAGNANMARAMDGLSSKGCPAERRRRYQPGRSYGTAAFLGMVE
jgi:hypothetical protein